MVGATCTDDPAAHADIAAVLKVTPGKNSYASERVAWLFRLAHALNRAGLNTEADTATEQALEIVRRAIVIGAGGDQR